MGPLAEYLKNEAEHLRAEEGKREEARAEWVAALERLFSQLENWSLEADGGLKLLRVDRPTAAFEEPRLGRYEIQILSFRLGSSSASVKPRARHVIASIRPPGQEPCRADGMVEIKGGSVAEYYLFRKVTECGDEWFLRNVSLWNSDPVYGTVDPLDRFQFEAALLRVLQ